MDSPDNSRHATVRTIAAAAGVSATTVGLALKNAARIPARTRQRIKAIAKKQGYRPDPAIRKLMRHLRTRHSDRLHANIAVLVPSGAEHKYYTDDLIDGMRERARTAGYALAVLNFANDVRSIRTLQRVLQSRGIEGVIFAPLPQPVRLSPVFDCAALSIVAATSSIQAPSFHSVMPNHYDNMIMACERLISRGYRRIGLATLKNNDERVRHRSAGAIAWNIVANRVSSVAPLVVTKLAASEVRQWLEQQRPDAVIADAGVDQIIATIVHAPTWGMEAPAVVTTNWPSPVATSGIDQREREIGIAAVDELAGMIERGEKGVPSVPRATMINGFWRAV